METLDPIAVLVTEANHLSTRFLLLPSLNLVNKVRLDTIYFILKSFISPLASSKPFFKASLFCYKLPQGN